MQLKLLFDVKIHNLFATVQINGRNRTAKVTWWTWESLNTL